MAVVKPAVANNPPLTVIATGSVSTSPRELIAAHFVNSTAGKGLVRIDNGNSNEAIYLGSDADGGNDSFEPAQPVKMSKITVTFVTGTGFLTLITN